MRRKQLSLTGTILIVIGIVFTTIGIIASLSLISSVWNTTTLGYTLIIITSGFIMVAMGLLLKGAGIRR